MFIPFRLYYNYSTMGRESLVVSHDCNNNIDK
nr:MAG TPA: hypothetical protein [Caudoviricetes sp.]